MFFIYFGLFSCGQDAKLIGKWEYNRNLVKSSPLNEPIIWEFKEDGSLNYSNTAIKGKTHWQKSKSNQLIIRHTTTADSIIYTIKKLNNKELILQDEVFDITLQRVE